MEKTRERAENRNDEANSMLASLRMDVYRSSDDRTGVESVARVRRGGAVRVLCENPMAKVNKRSRGGREKKFKTLIDIAMFRTRAADTSVNIAWISNESVLCVTSRAAVKQSKETLEYCSLRNYPLYSFELTISIFKSLISRRLCVAMIKHLLTCDMYEIYIFAYRSSFVIRSCKRKAKRTTTTNGGIVEHILSQNKSS